ncbi:MAG: radical SAM protein [Lentisphaeria bacterium]|nr:radical SAM protein [Lentisphaeria bacterium]
MSQRTGYHKSPPPTAPCHRADDDWLRTSAGEKRGYIDPRRLRELWFHTGTACNLRCPDCFEHAAPGDQRLDSVKLGDVTPFIDEAVALGVEKFSFTGGEPFVVRDIISILDYALDFRPCLVLTNGTQPLRKRFDEARPLSHKSNGLSFRVSLDYPDRERHDAGRGAGMFDLALDTLGDLHRHGFHVSVARRHEDDEDTDAVTAAYRPFFAAAGLPADTPVISFPNLERADTPEITENCMTTYHTPESCETFMCAFSRMVVKQHGRMRVYACTLVDDNPFYDLGSSLAETAKTRVLLGHPRCFACFAGGASCSEL